jgi:outer membrane biosynthesis protein TonB
MMNGKVPINEQLLSQATKNQSLKKFLRWAIIFHVVVIIVGLIGLPHWRQPIDLTKAVSVDLVAPNAENSAAPNKTKSAKPLNPQAKLKDEPPKPPKVIPDKPPEPVQSDAAQKEETPKPEEKPKEKTETPKENATKQAENKVDLNKKKKKSKDNNKGDKEKQQQFNSVLKNLLADDKEQPAGNPIDAIVDEATKESGVAPTTSETLSLSDMDALKYQLAKCWNVPTGAMNAEDLIIDIRVEVNPDRTVKSAEIVDTSRYSSDSFFAAAADSAKRALFNPQCTPLALPAEKYDVWKTLLIRFNPKDMFGG